MNMNIRKIIMSATAAVMTLSTATCFAMIPISELNIGGVYLEMPLSEVVNRFGQPINKAQTPPKGYYNYTFQNGNSTFSVTPKGFDSDSIIEYMNVRNGDMLTNAGIGIGSSYADVKAAYGEPDNMYGTHLMYSGGIREGRYGECVLEFDLDSPNGHVKQMGFNVIMIEGEPIGKGKPMHKPSQPQEPKQPVSTIPKSVQEIPESEFYIGGITIGQTFDQVEKIYGKPGKIVDEGFFQTYNYNDRFIVKAKLNQGYKVCSVAIYEKGIATPSGFTGEMPFEAVTKKYGAGHETKFKGEGVEAKLKGCKDYTYFFNNKQMVFLVDKKGIIKAIRVEDRDDQKFIEAKRKK